MSDFLSQDEIDGLLQADGNESFDVKDVEDGEEASAEPAGPDYGALTKAFDFFNEQASTIISQALNKEITFSVSQCEAINQETLQGSLTAPLLALSLPIEGGITGLYTVIISTKDVAALSDFMMMGDGKAEYSEDHKDAIAELFNQIMGAYTTALGEKCGSAVSAGTIEANEFDLSAPSISLDDTDMIIDTATIADFGDITIGIVINRETSQEQMNAFKEPQDAGGELTAGGMEDLAGATEGFDNGEDFHETSLGDGEMQAGGKNISMLMDVEMDVTIELGKADLSIKKILELAPGSVIELDRMAGEPVDLVVNNKVVAKGEVVVVDENFGIRIVSLVSPEDRIKSLR